MARFKVGAFHAAWRRPHSAREKRPPQVSANGSECVADLLVLIEHPLNDPIGNALKVVETRGEQHVLVYIGRVVLSTPLDAVFSDVELELVVDLHAHCLLAAL